MIAVEVLKAKKNIIMENNTFLEGERYFGRMSKNGDMFVVKSEEGNWVVIEQYQHTLVAKHHLRLNEIFSYDSTIYMKSRKSLNKYSDFINYTLEGNYNTYGLIKVFYDSELYDG